MAKYFTLTVSRLVVALLFLCNSLTAQTPAPVMVRSRVIVPASMRAGQYSTDRFLTIPQGSSISVYARIPGARFMAITPDGNLLVSASNAGQVKLVRPNASGDPLITNFVTGLDGPHDIVFHTIGTVTYVYIAEDSQVSRYTYTNGDLTGRNRQVVVPGLPGNGNHPKKNIAIDSNHKLYVSIASSCNVCASDVTTSNPKRAAIYQYNADGTGGRLFALGLRNAEGLDFVPGTNDLWVVVNNRDDMPYPFNDNTGNYGKIIPDYVDNNPLEPFTKVRDGGNYGWPYCNSDSRAGINNMPYANDYNTNRNGTVNCSTMDRINKGLDAHSAPLGLLFSQNTKLGGGFNHGALTALHGSWNRQKKTGYKVLYLPWNTTTNLPGNEMSLVDGFLGNDSSTVFARPVDIAIDQQGSLFISDDYSGSILKLTFDTPTAVKSALLDNSTEVYPMPATNNVMVRITLQAPNTATLSITNMQGQQVYSGVKDLSNGENNFAINTESLEAGMYYLSIVARNDKTIKKVIIVK